MFFERRGTQRFTQRNAEGVEGWEKWVWGMVKNDIRHKKNDLIILSKCEN